MRDISKLSIKELSAYISHYLRDNGVVNVLTGHKNRPDPKSADYLKKGLTIFG